MHQRSSEKISSLKIFRETHVKSGQESRSKIMQELWLTDLKKKKKKLYAIYMESRKMVLMNLFTGQE